MFRLIQEKAMVQKWQTIEPSHFCIQVEQEIDFKNMAANEGEFPSLHHIKNKCAEYKRIEKKNKTIS